MTVQESYEISIWKSYGFPTVPNKAVFIDKSSINIDIVQLFLYRREAPTCPQGSKKAEKISTIIDNLSILLGRSESQALNNILGGLRRRLGFDLHCHAHGLGGSGGLLNSGLFWIVGFYQLCRLTTQEGWKQLNKAQQSLLQQCIPSREWARCNSLQKPTFDFFILLPPPPPLLAVISSFRQFAFPLSSLLQSFKVERFGHK